MLLLCNFLALNSQWCQISVVIGSGRWRYTDGMIPQAVDHFFCLVFGEIGVPLDGGMHASNSFGLMQIARAGVKHGSERNRVRLPVLSTLWTGDFESGESAKHSSIRKKSFVSNPWRKYQARRTTHNEHTWDFTRQHFWILRRDRLLWSTGTNPGAVWSLLSGRMVVMEIIVDSTHTLEGMSQPINMMKS